ncbi:hypothetical protein AHF37_03301 [Paragonimus kellicotti]|nr:hypothetical protein AHF37_03301 [Paragonimus kellicotti]
MKQTTSRVRVQKDKKTELISSVAQQAKPTPLTSTFEKVVVRAVEQRLDLLKAPDSCRQVALTPVPVVLQHTKRVTHTYTLRDKRPDATLIRESSVEGMGLDGQPKRLTLNTLKVRYLHFRRSGA